MDTNNIVTAILLMERKKTQDIQDINDKHKEDVQLVQEHCGLLTGHEFVDPFGGFFPKINTMYKRTLVCKYCKKEKDS